MLLALRARLRFIVLRMVPARARGARGGHGARGVQVAPGVHAATGVLFARGTHVVRLWLFNRCVFKLAAHNSTRFCLQILNVPSTTRFEMSSPLENLGNVKNV